MELWAWCGEIQTQSTGFHGQGMVCSLFIHLFDVTADSSTHPPCNDTGYLYPGTVARQKSPPFTGRHAHVQQPWSLADPQRPVGKQEQCQSLDHHTQGSSYLLLCPAQGSLSTSVFITSWKPSLNQDHNILLQGQACRRGECDENIKRRNIMAHLFLMKGFSENSPSKGLDT